MPAPNVFTIAPGAPFLATFAQALCAGEIIAGLGASNPEALARTTIYVPTRRAARALAQELALALKAPAVLLPRIRPLGGLEETERGMAFSGTPGSLALPQPIGDIQRRMLLAGQVLAWGRALKNAIVSVDDDGAVATDPLEAIQVASHFAGAWHLAGDLAALIDEMIIEDVAWKNLDDLGGRFDEYWRITLNFLNIAIASWPEILNVFGKVDPARHQVQLVDAQMAELRAGRAPGPVIAIGSTGTNRATARLLAAIAQAEQGAVVLPGLDKLLDDGSFALIGGLDAQADPAASHPQAALHRLLPVLGAERGDVRELGNAPPALAARQSFVSQALRPADSTEKWGEYLAAHGEEISAALAGLSLIEAADEREEALALAIAMREVLEAPGATAALVTPSRELAARVRAELLRWQIVVDDSGGTVFGMTPHGALARLALACAESRHAATDVIALLAHPLVAPGMDRQDAVRLAPLVEVGLLRAVLPQLEPGNAADVVEAAIALARHRHAHPAQARITDEEWDGIETLMAALGAALAPLAGLEAEAPVASWAEAHRQCLLALMQGGGLPEPSPDAEMLAGLLEQLEQASTPAIGLTCAGYRSFFDALAQETVVRGPVNAHPRLKILGLLEARLIHADVMLLGGLDESIWPPQARSDAFLNRTMRATLGLSPPERRLGQTAHDFAQALGCEKVILSRAAKRGGSPMVASRFLLRMAALAGPHWQALRKRGGKWLDLARRMDEPRFILAPQKPRPRPPLQLRPHRLSVTQIETLRRDPYGIFARHILNLLPLDPLGVELGAREKGLFLHDVLARFCTVHPDGPLPADSATRLAEMARAAMRPLLENAAFRAFQWPQVEKALHFYLGFEAARRGGIRQILVETPGQIEVPLQDGSVFTLTARPDRLEINRGGTVTIVDYKTGTVPSVREVQAGFSPQLTLEAIMADMGCFGLPRGAQSNGAVYLKLGGADGGHERALRFKEAEFHEVLSIHYEQLQALLNQFRLVETPYLSKPYAKFIQRFSVYDHLARSGEWAGGTAEEGP